MGQDRAAAADDAGDAIADEREGFAQDAGVDGHVIDALLGLLFDHFEHEFDGQIFGAANARDGFVNWHGADGDGRGVDDGFANGGDVAAGGEIHHGVGAVVDGAVQLFEFVARCSEVVAELPMLALILQRKATPMPMGSRLT